MLPDFGLAVSPSFRVSPLRSASARAIKLWIFLAAQMAYVPRWKLVAGHRIDVGVGEVLISMRGLRGQLGCGLTQLRAALDELEGIGAVEIETVQKPARRFPDQERARSQIENTRRSRNRIGVKALLSRIKVNGVRPLAARDKVLVPGTRSNKGPEAITNADRQHRQRVLAILEAEGR